MSYERDGNNQNAKFGRPGVIDFDNSSGSGDEDYMFGQPNELSWDMQTSPNVQIPPQSYGQGVGSYSTPPYSAPVNQQEFTINDIPQFSIHDSNAAYEDHATFDGSQPPALPRSDSTWSGEQYTSSDLSDMLGDLKINVTGVGKNSQLSMPSIS